MPTVTPSSANNMQDFIVNSSRLGLAAHVHLVNLIKSLAPDYALSPLIAKHFKTLLYTTDPQVFAYYFNGADATLIQKVLHENVKNYHLRSIENADIATLLVAREDFTQASALQINEHLYAMAKANSEDLTTLSTQLWDKLLKVDPSKSNYKQVTDSIMNTCLNNQSIYDAAGRTFIVPNLINLFLRIPKNQPVSELDFKEIQSLYQASSNPQHFLEKCREFLADTYPPEHINELLAALQAELTPALYREIKNSILQTLFNKGSIQERQSCTLSVGKTLDNFLENFKCAEVFIKQNQVLAHADDGYLFSPLLAKVNDRHSFKNRLIQCTVFLNELDHQLKIIRDFDDLLTPNEGTEALRKRMNKELDDIEQMLKKIHAIQQALWKITKRNHLDQALVLTYQYPRTKVSVIESESKAKPQYTLLPLQESDSQRTTISTSPVHDHTEHYLKLEARPRNHEMLSYDLDYDNTKEVARFVYKNTIHTPLSSSDRYEITHFPQNQLNKVDYSLRMAIQVTLDLKHAPSKKHPLHLKGNNLEQVHYLWTALMIIGSRNPHMRFGSGALIVDCPGFHLSQQLDWFGFYQNDSIYKEQFCIHQPHIDLLLKPYLKDMKQRFDKKNVNKMASQIQNPTASFKKHLKYISKEVKERQATEGCSVAPGA